MSNCYNTFGIIIINAISIISDSVGLVAAC